MLKVMYASANNLETSFDCSTEFDCIKEMLSLMVVDTMIRCTVSGMFVNSRMSVLKRLHRLPSGQDLLRNCKTTSFNVRVSGVKRDNTTLNRLNQFQLYNT